MKDFKLTDLIEKYRFVIGGGLLVLILIGSGILLYRENYTKPKMEDKVAGLEKRINELQNKIQDTSNNNQANANAQASNVQAEQPTIAQNTDNAKQTTASAKVTGKINLNTATAAQLDTLPGIGVAYAQRIIDYRNSKGGFKTIDEIKNVKGIGDKTFEKFKDLITVN